jgi:hypothetical protein
LPFKRSFLELVNYYSSEPDPETRGSVAMTHRNEDELSLRGALAAKQSVSLRCRTRDGLLRCARNDSVAAALILPGQRHLSEKHCLQMAKR